MTASSKPNRRPFDSRCVSAMYIPHSYYHFTLLLLLLAFAVKADTQQTGCYFPESEVRPFFFELPSNVPDGTVVVNTVVEPKNSQIKIASVKSDNLQNIDYADSFAVRKTVSRFIISLKKPLHLPPYPSNITETYLYITIECNNQLYPLITVHVRHQNQYAPQFYGQQPYRITINRELSVGSIIRTPVLAFDWDPIDNRNINYAIEAEHPDGLFALSNKDQTPVAPEELPEELLAALRPEQYPTILKIRLLEPLAEQNVSLITLNISAKDSGEVALKNYTVLQIRLVAIRKPVPIIRPISQVLIEKHEAKVSRPSTAVFDDFSADDSVTVVDDMDQTIAVLTTVASEVITAAETVAPTFVSNYTFTLPENVQSINFGQVQCLDSNVPQRKIFYRLESPAIITVDGETGSLSTLDALDYEQSHTHNIKILCCLQAQVTACDHTTVHLVVNDLNDNAPQFELAEYVVEIPFDLVPNSPIVTVKATDQDSGDNGKIIYSLKDGQDLFDIDSNTGTIRLRSSLSVLANLSLVVEASDAGYPVQSNRTRVVIRVGDSNPSSPVFDRYVYEVKRFTPVPAGSVLITLHATDPDPGRDGQITYHIVRVDGVSGSKKDMSKFSINPLTGQLSTNVRLTDQDTSPTSIVVEAVDQSPEFSRKGEAVVQLTVISERKQKLSFYPLPKRIFISSSLPPGTAVLNMSTSQTDATQFFSLQNSNGSELFEMIGDELQVKRQLKEGVYEIIMHVDAGSSSVEHQLTAVVMTEREKYPVFEQLNYDLQIPHDVTYPFLLYKFEAILTDGVVEYGVYPADRVPDGLVLDKHSGEMFIEEDFANIYVQPVFVVVRARNIKFPEYFSDVGVVIRTSASSGENFSFTQSLYQFQVAANAPPGTLLNGSVNIQNYPDSVEVEYTVEPSDVISVDANGTLKTLIPFNVTNTFSPIYFTIYARTATAETSSRVRLTVKDLAPVAHFESDHYQFSIVEDAEPGVVLGVLRLKTVAQSSIDSIAYQIIDGDPNALFETTDKGYLIRSEIGTLDRELNDYYNLTVEASRNGVVLAETLVSVTVLDVNDNVPRIDGILIWNLTEDKSEIGAKFLLNATDEDLAENSTLYFHLKMSPQSSSFQLTQLSNTTAELTLMKALHNFDTAQIILQVEVSDGGNPRLKSVSNITVNIMPQKGIVGPLFKNNAYIVDMLTNISSNVPIIRVEAENLNSEATPKYRIVDDAAKVFWIDEKTGDIRLTNGSLHLSPGSYQLKVEADDGYAVSSTEVVINVPDDIISSAEHNTSKESLNKTPIFGKDSYTFVVSDLSEPKIGQLTIADPENYSYIVNIQPAEYANLFKINSQTGDLIVTHFLDKHNYSFVVTATDHEAPEKISSANVTVIIDDDLENLTTSEASPYTSSDDNASRTPTTQAELTETTASESFEECNFNLLKLVDEVVVTKHAVNSLSPIYTVSGTCSCANKCKYELKLNNDDDALSQWIKVGADGSVYIDPNGYDTLQNDSRFIDAGRLPITVLVDNFQTGQKQQFKLYLTFKSHQSFSESTDTGTTVSYLYSSEPYVTSTDGDAKNNLSYNFNFEYDSYKAVTPEGTYKSGTVLSMRPDHIRVTNVDENNKIFYYISSAEQNLPFYIRNNTAEIIIFGNVDREVRAKYEFSIIAVDRSSVPKMTKTSVTVEILDVNDNAPEFRNPVIAVPLLRSTPVNHLITTFNAVDSDNGLFGEVRYSLYNYSDIFSLSEKAGELRLKAPLDKNDEYVYYMSVIANDLGKPVLKSLHNFRIEVFDENQLVPEFRKKRYAVSVGHDATVGTVITQVLAGMGPYRYHLQDSHSGLFEINNDGVIRFADTPLKTEHDQIYVLNVTAIDNNEQQSSTQVEIHIEGSGVLSTSAKPQTAQQCKFSSKQFDAEVYENQVERKKILQLTSNCDDDQHIYVISQGSGEFEIDAKTGELYVVQPLDREKRSIYFLVVDIVQVQDVNENVRHKRQANIIELLKAKLQPSQALVTVRVLDQNDNVPHFVKTNADGNYVYSVDWQAPLLTPIARIHAEDADERTPLQYTITAETVDEASNFMLNHTSGVLSLAKSLLNSDKDVFRFDVMVTDGVHNITNPVMIYKLSPETNVVLLAVDKDRQDIEEWVAERKISEQLGVKFNILGKQPYVDDSGVVDPKRTHLFVYASDEKSNIPLERDTLKELLERNTNELDEILPSMSVFLPSINSKRALSSTETVLLVFCAIILLTACCILVYILKFCKRKSGSQVTDSEYMIDSHTAGPRPYNVAEIKRKTAQSILSSRPLPDPYETKDSYDAHNRSTSAFSIAGDTVEQRSLRSSGKTAENIRYSSDSSYCTAGPRSKNFSGNVEHVHTLVNQQLQERRHNDEQDYHIDETMFPVYRYQGYQHS